MGEAGLSWGGLSLWGINYDASIWYASTVSDSGRRNGFDELDYTSTFSRDFGFANLAVGNIYYNFYRDRDRDGFKRGPVFAQEVFFSASRQFWQTDFAFTYFWDVDEDNDGYSELTIDRSFVLSECLQLALGGTASYDIEEGDMHHYGLSTALNWEYNDVLTVSPYISATWAQDGAKYGAQGNRSQGDELFGGITVTASF